MERNSVSSFLVQYDIDIRNAKQERNAEYDKIERFRISRIK